MLCVFVYIVVVYFAGKGIEKAKKKDMSLYLVKGPDKASQLLPVSKFVLLFAVVLTSFWLIYAKYSNFLIAIWNWLFQDSVGTKSVSAALGLSFITFSAISYLVDIYRGTASSGTLIDCALYVTFFPKVVSGPIILWRDFQKQISFKKVSLDQIINGLNRIMIGFAKKVILADQFGLCLSRMSHSQVDMVSAWGAAFLYMLQIFFDFSGYSDIAIGLANIFGFEFKENFNFPYRSKSISEFWRRWHISLGTWFREYIYIPLGGSRKGLKKTLYNLATVFLVTGLWHGASWNYFLWGAINGAFVLLERVIRDNKVYKKLPDFIKWLGTMFVTLICWQFFRYENIGDALNWLGMMFGIVKAENIGYTWIYYFDAQMITFMVIGFIGSTVLGDERIKRIYHKLSKTAFGFAVQEMVLLLLFALAIMFMVNSTYSPFIYFQY